MRRSPLLAVFAALASSLSLVASADSLRAQTDVLRDCTTNGDKVSQQTSIQSDDGERRMRVSWSNGRCSIDMRAEGEFEFERDLSDVRSMSRGAFIEIDVRPEDGARREYEVRRDGDSIVRKYSVNREEQPIDAEAKRWIAAMMLQLERRTGFMAHSRVSDLLRDGGPNAVMDEVSQMESDYVQRRYLSIMLDSAKLAEPDVRRVLQLAGEELSSDFEHASFLVDLGKDKYVTTAVAGDFVQSTTQIESDFERRRALGAVLKLEDLPADVVAELLRGANSFESDFERAELLTDVARIHGLPNGAATDAYLQAATGIESDFEHSRVLAQVAKSDLTDDQLYTLLSSLKSIESDFELANLLARIADGRSLSGRTRDAYLAATETIESDFERRRALSALLGTTRQSRM